MPCTGTTEGGMTESSGQHIALRIGQDLRDDRVSAVYCCTHTLTPEPFSALPRKTRSIAFWKSAALALEMSTNVCGFRSTSGNQLLWIWTMMRCPARNVWQTSGMVKSMASTLPGANASGLDKLLRNLPRN